MTMLYKLQVVMCGGKIEASLDIALRIIHVGYCVLLIATCCLEQ